MNVLKSTAAACCLCITLAAACAAHADVTFSAPNGVLNAWASGAAPHPVGTDIPDLDSQTVLDYGAVGVVATAYAWVTPPHSPFEETPPPVFEEVASASETLQFAPKSLSVFGSVRPRDYFDERMATSFSDARVDGTLNFAVTTPGAVWFEWLFAGPTVTRTQAIVTLTNGVDVLLSCRGTEDCDLPAGGPSRREGLLSLDVGNYQLIFGTFSERGAGVVWGNDFSFSLNPVPLPGALWLFVSGVGAMAIKLRRPFRPMNEQM